MAVPAVEVPNPEKITRQQWMSLGGAFAGWTLDAMDWMLLALSLPLITGTFHCTQTQLGLLAGLTLAGAAVGGTLMGILADRWGRVRMLMFTMVIYGVFTASCGFAQSFNQLLVLRILTGIGLGGEWGVGATLVAEYWPDRYRAKCTSLVHSGWPVGYGLATLAFLFITPRFGWRGLFFVGIIPALIAIWLRTAVPEPAEWVQTKKDRAVKKEQEFPLRKLFSGELLRSTIFGGILAAGALMAYWGSATWLPSYLVKARHLNVLKTSKFLILLNFGAFLGYQFFGWFADRFGRRLSFALGMSGTIVVTVAYVLIPSEFALLCFGPVFGFVSYGFFGPFGAFISELFPPEARATGTTLVFNIGRACSIASPVIIGSVAEARGLGWGLGTTAAFNVLGLIALFLLPETVRAGVRVLAPRQEAKSAAGG